MLFNSLGFAVFFLFTYFLYLLSANRRNTQNILLLLASLVFYAAWDWRFISLLLISIIIDYYCGIKIFESESKKKKLFLMLSIISNLVLLGFFKYFNFFTNSSVCLLKYFGIQANYTALNIVLPVGISFYTFQTLSYSIDIYRNKLEPTRNLLDYALYVSFFPQLVAGPIERAKHLLPQIISNRKIELARVKKGVFLIAWGLYQKVFVADNLAKVVNPVFSSNPPYDGLLVLIATYAFAFQVYCDFSGYSDIARGLGKLMGFDIMVNFRFPYLARNPNELWQRWHISLSTWFRDYVYKPLRGEKTNSRLKLYLTIFITFTLIGLWHGASWTFILWGAYHGLLIIIYRIAKPAIKFASKYTSIFPETMRKIAAVSFFFQLWCIGALIFRANSIKQATEMLKVIPTITNIGNRELLLSVFYCLWFFIPIHLYQYKNRDYFIISKLNPVFHSVFYLILIYSLAFFAAPYEKEFIYFQF